MKVFRDLDHVAIGVNDMEKAKAFFCGILGGELLRDTGRSEEEGFDWVSFELGGKKLELVTPHVRGEGGVGRYIEKNGEGFHHLSISVMDLPKAIEYFEANGIRVLGVSLDGPGWKHCYLHPKDTFGAMIQVYEWHEHDHDHEDAD